jgi:hypothetical protein
MTKGLEIRAQIDTEVVKGLLLVNGGGAVALLPLLSTVIGKSEFEPLVRAILLALLCFQVGLVCAVVHNRLRRVCSHVYELHDYQPPPGKLFGIQLKKPRVCFLSERFMWLSLALFVAAGAVVFAGGICVL